MKLYKTYCPSAAELLYQLMVHYLRLIWQGWMPLGKQAVDMPLMLVELQEGFWSPSVTFEGGHVYASGAVRITWSKNQKQQQQKNKKQTKPQTWTIEM